MNEDRSARYHKLGRRAAVASTAWSAGLLVCLAATPLSLRLRAAAEAAASPLHPALQPTAVVLVYLAGLGIVHEAGALPFAFYRSFLLERRYGLSTERPGRWASDHLKGIALGAALSVVGLPLLYAAIRSMPQWWWLVAAAGSAGLAIALTGLAPVLLLPVFFTFRPLARTELRDRLFALSHRAGIAVTDVCEWQMSDRTRKANAALTGLGRTRRILISDTLLAGHSDDEIEVILAHELGHHVHRDVWKGIVLQGAVAAVGFYAASRVLPALAPRLGWSGPADAAGIPALMLTVGAVALVLMPVAAAASRAMERSADRFALDLTGKAEAFADAIERLGARNLAEERPSRLARWFYYTHPPVAERAAAARARRRAG